MDAPKSSATRAAKDPSARLRLAKLEERHRRELMDPDARLELWETIVRLRRRLGL